MQNLTSLVMGSSKPIYVYLSNPIIGKQFLCDAEHQGFRFSDGAKPTDKPFECFYAIHNDMTISYIGTCGRIAFQCNAGSIIRLDYAEYLRNC